MSQPPLFVASKSTLDQERKALEDYSWAAKIVERRFKQGLERVFAKAFVASRSRQFVGKADPVYLTLPQGMHDEALSRILTSNWTVAHTLATQSRFWLEDAVVDLLVRKGSLGDEPRPEIYSLRMLADGWNRTGRSIWSVGEHWKETLHGRGAWRPLIQERTLEEIERIVGEEERRFEDRLASRRQTGNVSDVPPATEDQEIDALARIGRAVGGRGTPIVVRCNLLLLRPETPHQLPGEVNAWGIRYINPTTFNQASSIKAERANLLRLYAYLLQEKPFRAPNRVRVVAADFLPRPNKDDGGRVGGHFSKLTRWNGDYLWQFLGVPFEAVTAGIRGAGRSLGEQLRNELTRLLRAQ